MNYTHAQILTLTGMTIDRLRHWRKEIPGLNGRAGRKGTLMFEEVTLLAVLSRATDELGLSVALIASHYEDLLAAFRENAAVGQPNAVLWLAVDSARIGYISMPPDGDAVAMIRIAPIIARLVEEVRRPAHAQLKLFSDAED
jgi:hypothetical protein